MVTALASRRIGRVVRAFRTHAFHGPHPLSQERVARWLGMTQPQLSRLETKGRDDRLDVLVHIARVLRIPTEHLWFSLPADSSTDRTRPDRSADGSVLGANSAVRTATVVATVTSTTGSAVGYAVPGGATDRFEAFLSSSARVFVIKGASGCGKTRLTYHLAQTWADRADFQIHAVDLWDGQHQDVATQILRYASLRAGEDSLLAVEEHCSALPRPCVVILDGMKTRTQFDTVARQVDTILRQVSRSDLRFVLVVRTPPEVDVSGYPVLAATMDRHVHRGTDASLYLQPWDAAQARKVWNQTKTTGQPAFADLPASIQQLAQLPLYLQLLRDAGTRMTPGALNAFLLVRQCVQIRLKAAGHDPAPAVAWMADLAQREAPDLLPAQFTNPAALGPLPPAAPQGLDDGLLPLARASIHGGIVFEHDVIREYALATRIVEAIIQRGRSATTVGAINELADKSATSAAARGVFEFMIDGLDADAPDLLSTLMLSPTINPQTTLPLVLPHAARGARFATAQVLRSCAELCTHGDAVALARALLQVPGLADALAGDYPAWLVQVLRALRSSVWPDVMRRLERSLDTPTARGLLHCADLTSADEATFFARYFFVFFADASDLADELETLLTHSAWRVRAALAEGIRDPQAPSSQVTTRILNRLVADEDYKVRAAAARAIDKVPHDAGRSCLAALLADDNWHVRECVLRAVLSAPAEPVRPLAVAAIEAVTAACWSGCPAQVSTLVQRLHLIHADTQPTAEISIARDHALFDLLRETRTGVVALPGAQSDQLVAAGRDSPSWLVRREATALDQGSRSVTASLLDPLTASEAYRRLRGRSAVQVALDVHDLDYAAAVAQAVSTAGVDFLEIGDPLIKHAGVGAIERIKRCAPNVAVVAEMMSADWGTDQVILAAEAGADLVFLIGPASPASVSAAVDAGRRLGLPIVLDVSPAHASPSWIEAMERVGVDGFVATANIDVGIAGRHTLAAASALRGWTRLPVAVSGGFSPTDNEVLASRDWDILIVGRGITEAVDPASAARQMLHQIHRRPPERRP